MFCFCQIQHLVCKTIKSIDIVSSYIESDHVTFMERRIIRLQHKWFREQFDHTKNICNTYTSFLCGRKKNGNFYSKRGRFKNLNWFFLIVLKFKKLYFQFVTQQRTGLQAITKMYTLYKMCPNHNYIRSHVTTNMDSDKTIVCH